MLKLLNGTDLNKYKPREFIVAESDLISIQKIKEFESKVNYNDTDYVIKKLYRSRKVGQSYLTSIITTLIAILYAIPLMFKMKPQLLLVNGPGTCIPCCLIVFLFSRILFLIPKCKIVFVESICRVKTLSLTGKILYHLKIADLFFVQWPELHKKYPRTSYMGRLV
jgi:beta-1,4-N-acetylglucosaminyltransferase